MAVQRQEETMFASEPEAPSSNPQWHAPVLNIYNAEDAETSIHFGHADSSLFYS
jgi:hypothetical protein